MLKYQDKKQIRKKRKIFRKVIVFVLLFVITILGVWGIFGGPLNMIFRPVLKIGNSISSGFSNLGYYFKNKNILSRENFNLQEENIILKTKMIDYEVIKKENLELKKTLNRLPQSNDFVLSSILTKPNRSPYDTVIVDAGTNDGIKVGSLVYAYGEIPVGRVTESYNNSSLITFYSSPSQKTIGFIEGVNADIELVGRGGGNFEAIVPVELNLQNGTQIYIPGFSAKILATVVDVISDPSDPFKKIVLSSPVNIKNLKWLEIKK